MYNKYEYINPLKQFNYMNYTLVLSDPDDGNPDIRIDKSFNLNLYDVDQSFLNQQAVLEMMLANNNLQNNQGG